MPCESPLPPLAVAPHETETCFVSGHDNHRQDLAEHTLHLIGTKVPALTQHNAGTIKMPILRGRKGGDYERV